MIIDTGLKRQLSIFIGSSSEALDKANKLQELLSLYLWSVIVWNQGTVFGLGESTLEALERAVLKYDYAIFILTPDDKLTSRGSVRHVGRDNVLFELGMFTGSLGRRKVFIVCPRGDVVALPSDLHGISTVLYNGETLDLAAAMGPVATQIWSAIRSIESE